MYFSKLLHDFTTNSYDAIDLLNYNDHKGDVRMRKFIDYCVGDIRVSMSFIFGILT